MQTDVEPFKAALRGRAAEEGFIAVISRTNLALYYTNEYYRTQQEYVIALADA